MPKKKKVVVIGGGTGTYQVLVGLKRYSLDLSAVIAMSDSGGSTGKLRRDLGILPPGDIRRALMALSDLPLASKTLEKLFNFRFENGKGLKGHSLGNLLLAALIQITGSEKLAINEASRILAVSGYVYPVTLGKTNLVAVLENGKRIHGESNIDLRWQGEKYSKVPIQDVYLTPRARVFPDAARAIEKADVIVIGPGDLYTSLLPNLLVGGVRQAITRSKAKVILVVNLMTKPGETDHFKASDFYRVVRDYLGRAAKKMTHVVVSNKFPDGAKALSWYKKHQSEPVEDNLDSKVNGIQVIRGSFAHKGEFLRHDPARLARAIMKAV
ncbi:hypothetical protein CMO96_01980 [Candidatus Woesebacteria bacterium]|nr:hypothetical protein [Candidatus Woesebacteria bacterium]|tara:strand:- start:259 stop:1236 length:978 start_codon:yes stop_codon:yes gene_type:complete